MPQGKNAPAPEAPEAPKPDAPPSVGDHDAPVGSPAWLIAQAEDLERERAANMTKIGKNRDQLRNLDALDALTEDQRAFVRVFYPLKKRDEQRSKEDITATREARERVRKSKPNGSTPADADGEATS